MEKVPGTSFFSQVFSVACTPSHLRSREIFVPGFQYSFGRYNSSVSLIQPHAPSCAGVTVTLACSSMDARYSFGMARLNFTYAGIPTPMLSSR